MEKTLRYSWYTDPQILERERERIFRPAWHYVGHTGQLAVDLQIDSSRRLVSGVVQVAPVSQ